MESLFSKILNMSLTASIVIVLVLAARYLLRRAPKIYSYALWAVVLFRLLCPVSMTASISALEFTKPRIEPSTEITSQITYVTPRPVESRLEATELTIATQSGAPAPAKIQPIKIAGWIWIAGVLIMAFNSAAESLRLRRRLIGAMYLDENIYLVDDIATPFVLGVWSPRIYLPSEVPQNQRPYIIAHEKHHIRRGDHLIKLLAYAALCIHWFNPLVWLAFVLAGKDMEMSCDEAVVRSLGEHIRADYSAALLRLATHRRSISGTPLAFGEGDTKSRVVNMSRWKKPNVWISILCTASCIAVLAACAVNPREKATTATEPTVQIQNLPAGYSYETDEDGNIIFTDGSRTVGGVVIYPIPDEVYDPDDDYFQWLEKMNIPDFSDSSLSYIGGMSSFSGGWIAEFASDVPESQERTVHHRHHFAVSGHTLYDIWCDMLLVDHDTQAELATAVQLPREESSGEPDRESTPRDIAYKTCGAVFDAAQEDEGPFQILVRQENTGSQGPGSHISTCYLHEGNFLILREMQLAGEYDSRQAYLRVDDAYFTNAGHWEDPGEIHWSEGGEYPQWEPWLTCFAWNRTNATYMDTLEDADGTCYMFRINAMFDDVDGYSDFYFANFYFDPEGNFVKLQMQVNLFQENEFTVTESIVSIDPEVISAEIQKEYRRATGK